MLFTIVIVLFLSSAFITHNNKSSVSIDFLFVEPIPMNLALALLLFFGIGALLGYFFSSVVIFKERALRKRLEKRIEDNAKIISGYTS